MYRFVNDFEDKIFRHLVDVIEECYSEENFNDLLDKENEPINLFGVNYNFSDVFESTDPVAYRTSYLDQCDYMTDDLQAELDRSHGETVFYGAHIYDLDTYEDED